MSFIMNRPHRSDSETSISSSSTGDAPFQFVANLSQSQLHHLQFSVPGKTQSNRLSKFLEGPRSVPVPNRFTFDPAQIALKREREDKERKEEECRLKQEAKEKQKNNKKVGQEKENSKRGSQQNEEKSLGHGKNDSMSSMSSRSLSSVPNIDMTEVVLTVEDEVRDVVDWRFYVTGVCLCAVNLMAAWEATMLSVALPTIATVLHGSTLSSFWLGISSLIAATCSLPLFARLSDVFGRKPLLITALTFFLFGSFISAVAGNFKTLHIGRSLQGIGAGGIYGLSKLIVSDISSTVIRSKWNAMISATWALGAATGPIIGGALAGSSHWRWIFWLHLPFCFYSLIAISLFSRLKSATSGSISTKLRSIDWVGHILFTGSIVSALLGLASGGTLNAWSNIRTLLPLILGVCGLELWWIWSSYSSFRPIIDLEPFQDRTSLATYFGAMVQGMIVSSALYFLPLYFGIAKPSQSLVGTGMSLLAWTGPLAAFALATCFMTSKKHTVRPTVWFGWCLVVVGTALMTLLTRTSSTALWVGIAITLGSGVGILYPSLSNASILSAGTDSKLASAVVNLAFFQSLGQTSGVAIGACAFQNHVYKQLLRHPELLHSAKDYTRDLILLVDTLRKAGLAKEPSLNTQILDGYIGSIRVVWIIMAAFAGVAMIASFIMKHANRQVERSTELKPLNEAYVV